MSKRNDNAKHLSESKHVGSSSKNISEISPKGTNNCLPKIVDSEKKDIDDCVLIKVDLSKRICKFGPVVSGVIVIEDSDEEVGVNKEECTKSVKSSEIEMRSSGSHPVCYMSSVCKKTILKASQENPLISQGPREQSPTLEMEVEEIQDEILAKDEAVVASVHEDVSTEQPDAASCSEKPIDPTQNVSSSMLKTDSGKNTQNLTLREFNAGGGNNGGCEASNSAMPGGRSCSCKHCPESFPNRTSLVSHILACHIIKPPLQPLVEKRVDPCPNCSPLLKSGSPLVNHECSSCNIKAHLPTQRNSQTSWRAVSVTETSTMERLLLMAQGNSRITSKDITLGDKQRCTTPMDTITSKVTSTPCGQNNTYSRVTTQLTAEKGAATTEEMRSDKNRLPKEKETASATNNESLKNDVDDKKKDAPNRCALTSTGNINKPNNLLSQNIRKKSVWCSTCSSWFTNVTELKAHLKRKPQCKVAYDELHNYWNSMNMYPGRSSYATKTTADNEWQPAKSTHAAKITKNNTSRLPGNYNLITTMGSPHCFSKRKRECGQAADQQSEDRSGSDARVGATTVKWKHPCKEGSREFSSEIGLLNQVAEKNCPGTALQNTMSDEKLNRAFVKLVSTSVMCKVCLKGFTDEPTLAKHHQNTPKCLGSRKAAAQCESCLCWFYEYEDLTKHIQLSESCQVGKSQVIANKDMLGDGLKCNSIKGEVDQQTSSGDVMKGPSSGYDTDDVDDMSSNEEGSVGYKCDHCVMVFTQKSKCKKHTKETHRLSGDNEMKGKRNKLHCKACKRKFDNVTLLQGHLLQNDVCFRALTFSCWNVVQKEKHLCLMCNKIFASDKTLRRHCFINMACRLRFINLVLKCVMVDKASSPVMATEMVTDNPPVESCRILPVRNDRGAQPVTAEIASSVQGLKVSSSEGTGQDTLKVSQRGWGAIHKFKNNKVDKNCGAKCVIFVDHVSKEKVCCSYYEAHEEEPQRNSFCFRCKNHFPDKRMFNTHICLNRSDVKLNETEACTASASHSQPHVSHSQPHVSHSQPHVSHSQPHVSHSQPHASNNQPHESHSQPHVSPSQPNVRYSQSHVSHIQPHESHSQPHVSHSQPHASHNQTHVSHSQPHISHSQPYASHSQASHNQPRVSHSQPDASHSQPHASHSQPHVSHSQPHASHNQPHVSHSQPDASHSQPHASHSQPDVSHSQPHVSHSQPHASHSQPHASHSQPHASHSQPHASHSQPHVSHSQHVPSAAEFPCMICDAQFPILCQLLEHSYQHTKEFCQVCKRCNLTFNHYNHFVYHMAFHLRMDKEPRIILEQADYHSTVSAQEQPSTDFYSKSLNSDAVQIVQCSAFPQKFDEISAFKDCMVALNDNFRPTSLLSPVRFQFLKSVEASDEHKECHEIPRTSRLVHLPAAEKRIISQFPQLCGTSNKDLHGRTDQKKHVSCGTCCRTSLSKLEVMTEMALDQIREHDSENKTPFIEHTCSLPRAEHFQCMFCLQEFTSDQDKLEHISKFCKVNLKLAVGHQVYALRPADSGSCQQLKYNSKRCEFCLKVIENKMAKVSPKNIQDAIKWHTYCDICQNIFRNNESLPLHKRRKHQDMNNDSHLPQVASDKEQAADHLYCFNHKEGVETEHEVDLGNGQSPSKKCLCRGTLKNTELTEEQLQYKLCDNEQHQCTQKGRPINHIEAKPIEGTRKLLSLHNKRLKSKSDPALKRLDASPKTSVPAPPMSVFSCSFCGTIVQHKEKHSHFKMHIKRLLQTVKRKSDKPMYSFSRESCPLCKKVCMSRKTLRIHLLQHAANDIVLPGFKPESCRRHSGLIRCIYCKRSFPSRAKLGRHALTAHNKILISVTRTKKTTVTATNAAPYQCKPLQ